MKELKKSKWAWTLYENECGDLVLSVLCGGVGMYEVQCPLSLEDRDEYMSAGDAALDLIADKVRSNPKKYSGGHA